jgi:hypothetical protein
MEYPPDVDRIEVRHWTLQEYHKPINDTFSDKLYILNIRVMSPTSEDQLKLLVEETEYLLNNTAITGFSSVKVIRKSRAPTDQSKRVFGIDMTVELKALCSSSAVAPSGGTTSTLSVGELTVTTHITGLGLTITDFLDEDNMASDSAVALASQQSIKAYVDGKTDELTDIGDVTATGAQLEDLLMFGSANAAWVPCPLEFVGGSAAFFAMSGNLSLYNLGADDGNIIYAVPLPPAKGSLKLYISGTRVSLADADGGDYVDTTYVVGMGDTTITVLDNDATNKTTVALHEDTFTAVDCSSYGAVKVLLVVVCSNANDLDIQYVAVRAYYA